MSAFLEQLQSVFHDLDQEIEIKNREVREAGGLPLEKQNIKIVGQVGLLLNQLPFSVAATTDLDLFQKPDFSFIKDLNKHLIKKGLSVDSDSHLIWMPENTKFEVFCDYQNVRVLYAHHKDIMKSKMKFDREKDQRLIQKYIAYFGEE